MDTIEPTQPFIAQPTRPLISFGQSIIDEIPKNPDAIFINRRYGYCEKCTFIGIWELYATNQSWDTVVAFYRTRLQGTRWNCDLVVNRYTQPAGKRRLPYQDGVM